MEIIKWLEEGLQYILQLAIILFEYVGVAVIICAGFRGIYDYVRRSRSTKLQLAKGLAMGLEFKLGSEILRTVLVRSLEEIVIVGAIIALRAVLTLLIHWEIKNETKESE